MSSARRSIGRTAHTWDCDGKFDSRINEFAGLSDLFVLFVSVDKIKYDDVRSI
jgi:hypothetical protein